MDINKGAEFKNTKWLEKLQWILIKGRSLKTLMIGETPVDFNKGAEFKNINDWRNSSGF